LAESTLNFEKIWARVTQAKFYQEIQVYRRNETSVHVNGTARNAPQRSTVRTWGMAIYAVSALRVGAAAITSRLPSGTAIVLLSKLWTHHRRWQNKEQNHGMKHYSFHASTMSKTVAIT